MTFDQNTHLTAIRTQDTFMFVEYTAGHPHGFNGSYEWVSNTHECSCALPNMKTLSYYLNLVWDFYYYGDIVEKVCENNGVLYYNEEINFGLCFVNDALVYGTFYESVKADITVLEHVDLSIFQPPVDCRC